MGPAGHSVIRERALAKNIGTRHGGRQVVGFKQAKCGRLVVNKAKLAVSNI